MIPRSYSVGFYRGGKLVEYGDLGGADEGKGAREPLLLSARELLVAHGALLGHAEQI